MQAVSSHGQYLCWLLGLFSVLTLMACTTPEPEKVWMEASEQTFVDCFFENYRQGIQGITESDDYYDDYYWVAVDVFYDCDLERPNRPFEKVADFMECIDQARKLYRSKYADLNDDAIAVVEEDMDLLYPKTLCWPANKLRELPDAPDFITE